MSNFIGEIEGKLDKHIEHKEDGEEIVVFEIFNYRYQIFGVLIGTATAAARARDVIFNWIYATG